jgi:hypothetical protein
VLLSNLKVCYFQRDTFTQLTRTQRSNNVN